MTEALLIGGALAIGGLMLWALMRASEAKGRLQERAEQAKDDANASRKAGAVIAEHRDDDDTAGRLQSGKF